MLRVRVAAVGAAAVLAATAVLTACTSVTEGTGRGLSQSAASPTTGTPGSSSPAPSCPSSYAAPDPNRPRVRLTFTVGDDLTTVTGTEHVVFTPDLPVTELVFRLTANTAPTVAEGNRITVTSARSDQGSGAPTYTRANAAASTQGGLLHIPLRGTVAAGTPITADVSFTLTLGDRSFDRFGRVDVAGGQRYSWFGSAQPLLAWQRGVGWHTEDLIDFTAESATSEAADTDLTVTAPAADSVIMSGAGTSSAGAGTTTLWDSTYAAARDVSVAVGPFAMRDTNVNGTVLRLGAPDAAQRDQLIPEFTRAIDELSKLYGPFPFPSLSVARLPASGGGIEYPSSILMLDGSRLVSVHETAHQWFYAMVGNSQALHPWLDEAFAQYSEERVNGETEAPNALTAPGAVDRSVESYGHDEGDYYFTTYDKGAAALQAARAAVSGKAFDAAIRCYVNANAWRIATPDDLKAALRTLPAAIRVLRTAGAVK
jgi:hypothetical protein